MISYKYFNFFDCKPTRRFSKYDNEKFMNTK